MLVIGFLGRISKEKGLHILLEAVKKSNCKLRVGGAGDGKYFKAVSELMLNNINCDYFGFVGDTKAFLDDIDVIVLPSLIEEALPTVLIEAMARRCIVISSDFPSVREIVGLDYNYLVEPGCVIALQKALLKICDTSYQRMDKIKTQNYERAYSQFRIEKQAMKMKEFFDGNKH